MKIPLTDMRAMLFLQRAIAPPTFQDEQQSRVALLLHRITLALALLALLYTISSLPLGTDRLALVFGLVVLGLCVALNRLAYAGYVRAASYGLAAGLWLAFTAGGAVGESAGVFDASFTGYILPIIVASFLLGGYAGMAFTTMSVIAGAVILVGQITNHNAPFPVPRLILQWGAESLIFIAAAYLLALSRRSWITAINRARNDEHILAEKNIELQQAVAERQRAENAFRVRYERLLRAFHSAGLETWIWDIHTNAITYPDTDPTIAAFFSQTIPEFLNRVHPDDREAVRKTIYDALSAKIEFELIFRLLDPLEGLQWYFVQGSPNVDPDGSVTNYIGSSFDITRRRIAEEGLHASEAAARAFLEKLKALHEVSIQLAQTATLDELYRQAVELARTRLGFDRIGLFLLSENPNEVIGTYGTDPQGNIRAEHDLRFLLDQNALVMESLNNKLHVAVQKDTDLWDNLGVIGRGWNAMAMLWNKTSAIGWLAADNLIHREPANDDQIELLSLFGSMLGPLILKKQAELETHRHQERLRLALQAGGMYTWTWNLRTNAIVIDDLQSIAVPTANQIDGALAQIHPDDQPLIQKALQRTTTEGIPYTVEYRILNNGVSRWVYALGQVYRNETGRVAGIVGVSQDITERKQAEERFYKAFQANPSAIAITALADGRYVEVNEEWGRLTGYTREETIGRTSVEIKFWDKPEDRVEFLTVLNRQGYLRDIEHLAGGKDGRKVPVMMQVEKIELGDEACLLTMLQDISGRKEAEKQALELALQRERVALLTEFMGNISHDIKTPLTVINTSLYLLERAGDVSKQQEKIETIRVHIQLLEKFIQDILTISRLDYAPGLDLEPVVLDALLRDIVMRLRPAVEKKNLTLTLQLDPALPAILGDLDELSRALVNLVENAVNYTPPGGTVQVRTYTGETHAVIEIADTGIGIGEADIARIFTRFYRAESARATHDSGTGLGLAIVKKIAEMHNGSVEVTSVVGKGSTFRIRLPLADASKNNKLSNQ